MSTLHKVKAYFGMAPMDDYEDEYYDDRAPSRGFPRARFDEGYGRGYDGPDYDDPRGEPGDYAPPGYRGGYADEPPRSAVANSTARTWAGRASGRGCAAVPLAARWPWTRAGWR